MKTTCPTALPQHASTGTLTRKLTRTHTNSHTNPHTCAHAQPQGRFRLAPMVAAALLGASAAHAADEPKPAAKPEADAAQTIVVTGTSSSSGVRKLDAGFSITTADSEAIKRAAPSSTADLLKIVPGVFAETTGGNAGANIRVRGFPMDGDAPYTTIQLNGSPLYPEGKLSFFENSSIFRLDDTVDRVEVLRGGPSTLYGNGQAGVTVNFIQKKGGEEADGGVRFTLGTGNLRRVDLNYSGKLAERWYIGLGGFYRTAQGVRDTQFPADQGGQGSIILTRRLDDGELNLYARHQDERNAFFTPIPVAASADGKSFSAFPSFDPLTATFYGNELRNIKLEVGQNNGTPLAIERDLQQGRGSKASNLGFDLTRKLSPTLEFSSKTSYMTASAPTYGLFTGPNPTTLGAYVADQVTAANADTKALAAAGRAATGGTASYVNGGSTITNMSLGVIQAGMWVVDKQLKALTSENRFNWKLGGGHTVTAGVFFSDYGSDDLWYLNRSMLMTVEPHARLIDIKLNNGVAASKNGWVTPPWTYDVNGHYNGRITAGYLADEWQLNSALRLDAGARIERREINGSLENLSNVDLDNNALTIYNNNVTVFNGSYTSLTNSATKASWTAGANYSLSKTLSTFVRVNSGHRFVDFDDLRDGKKGVEDITQLEVGLKTVTPLYSAFITAYTNQLKNSQFQAFTAAGNVTRNGGSRTHGLEFEATLKPMTGLDITATGNLADAKYVDSGDISGNRVERQPRVQMRLTPSYRIPTEIGQFRVFGTYTHVGERYGSKDNQQVLPAYHTLDAGVVAQLANGVEVRLTGSNLTNTFGLTEGNIRSATANGVSGGAFLARPLFGRSYELSVGMAF